MFAGDVHVPVCKSVAHGTTREAMFTGLIADLGSVSALQRDAAGATLTLATALAGDIAVGDSVAVNGVCLTATAVNGGGFRAQAIEETLRRSSLGDLQVGSPVNLELALRAGDRLGGHIVQGHVDGTGTVAEIRPEGFARVLSVADIGELARYTVAKGSIAIDGISLTISALQHDRLSVSLIPETLQRTNLGRVEVGQRVNLEVDILAKHVERLMEARA
jgi:riboflavin synthase